MTPSRLRYVQLPLWLGLIVFLVVSARAEVKLASPFTSHMVLQCDRNVPVWGTAEPGEKVTVKFAGQKESTTADAAGHWRLELKAMRASAESRAFLVSGSKTKSPLQLDDVLVGEVWLASGQSNMDFTLSKKVKRFAGVTNEEQEIAAANYPLIRMFTGDAMRTNTPQTRIGGEWKVCTPENAPAFSAVGYFFARDLQRQINVPVGIVTLAYGASTAEAWIQRDALARDPVLKPMLERFDAAVEKFRTNAPPVVAEQRSEDVSATNAAPRARNRRDTVRDPIQDQHNPTVLFNGMIAPVIPFAIRGAVWYQGESIVGGSEGIALYPRVQTTLIRNWRSLWKEGDFPFYIVQLAGQEAASNKPEVREAQATVLSLPNTGIAVAMDIGEAKNVHPKNKQDVGDRLARIAAAKVYGKHIEYSGPVYESMKVEGAKIRLTFSHADGLSARDGELKWFSIAGADGKFVPATAKIEGNHVIVSSPEVLEPTNVRYGWVNFPQGGNLYNSAGLPAVQFRTDDPDSATVEAVEDRPTAPKAAPNKSENSARARRPENSPANTNLPSLFLIGDSTVRNGQGKGDGGQWGWGDWLAPYFDTNKLNVVNRALGGTSSRTFYNNQWPRVRAMLKTGDFVIMQFGHNDNGALNDTTRARGTIKGVGEESETITNLMTHAVEVVHSFGWYEKQMIREAREKGATPMVCSLIPRNSWQGGRAVRNKLNYAGWAEQVAKSENAPFLDINEIIAHEYDKLGEEKVKPLFVVGAGPHTSLAGAQTNAACVIAALKGLHEDPLAKYFSDKANEVSPATP